MKTLKVAPTPGGSAIPKGQKPEQAWQHMVDGPVRQNLRWGGVGVGRHLCVAGIHTVPGDSIRTENIYPLASEEGSPGIQWKVNYKYKKDGFMEKNMT